MRVLVGMGLFKEISRSGFAATSLASAYVTVSPLADAVVHLYGNHIILIEAQPNLRVPVARISTSCAKFRSTWRSMAFRARMTRLMALSNMRHKQNSIGSIGLIRTRGSSLLSTP